MRAVAVVLIVIVVLGMVASQIRSPADAVTDRIAASSAPCNGVVIQPGDDLQEAVRTHSEGTVFCLTAGLHRLARAVPKNNQRFVGVGKDTVLSGATVLATADVQQDESGYYWDQQSQESQPRGTLIGPGHAEAPNQGDVYSEELFVTRSGNPQDPPTRYRRVMSLSELGAGQWFFDQEADRIYLAQNPAGLGLIEVSVFPTAIWAPQGGESRGVVIENLVVEKYASAAQQAAVGGEGAYDWDIRRVTVRYNHGAGVHLGPGTLLENSSIHHMGQVGLLGGGDATTRPTIVRSTEVAYNKTLSFDPDWEAGGTKFTRVYGLGMIVENSWFHHNFGPGLWFDIDNRNVVIRSNRFEANDRWGVLYEVSRQAKIYWNEAFDTTRGPEGHLFYGAGICISNSSDVEVYENLLYDNSNGIFVQEDRGVARWAQETYREGLPHIANVDVYANDVRMHMGVTGMRVENGEEREYWEISNILFLRNTYRVDDTQDRFVGPGNELYTFDEWQELGNDRDGTALSTASTGSLPPGATSFVMSEYGALS